MAAGVQVGQSVLLSGSREDVCPCKCYQTVDAAAQAAMMDLWCTPARLAKLAAMSITRITCQVPLSASCCSCTC